MHKSISIKDAARKACVTPTEIRAAIDAGELKSASGYRGVRVDKDSLLWWMEAREDALAEKAWDEAELQREEQPMKLTITLELDNDQFAFGRAERYRDRRDAVEVASVLQRALNNIRDHVYLEHGNTGGLSDANGNWVGTWGVSNRK